MDRRYRFKRQLHRLPAGAVVEPQRFGSELPDADLAAALDDAAERLHRLGAGLVVHMPWLYIRDSDRERWAAFLDHFISRYEPDLPVVAADPEAVLRSERDDFCDSPCIFPPKPPANAAKRLPVPSSPMSKAGQWQETEARSAQGRLSPTPNGGGTAAVIRRSIS